MKTILSILSLCAFSANAADYVYNCHQVRTTAEEQAANCELKSVKLFANKNGFLIGENEVGVKAIMHIDNRLSTGGAPFDHVSYGGYLQTTQGETFLCKRSM